MLFPYNLSPIYCSYIAYLNQLQQNVDKWCTHVVPNIPGFNFGFLRESQALSANYIVIVYSCMYIKADLDFSLFIFFPPFVIILCQIWI